VKAARAPMKPAAKVVMTAVIAGGVWFACADPDAHVFIAGQYIAQLDCVTPGEAVDVLDGPPVDASCEATCVIPAQSNGSLRAISARGRARREPSMREGARGDPT
jgi:hypothetical protein